MGWRARGCSLNYYSHGWQTPRDHYEASYVKIVLKKTQTKRYVRLVSVMCSLSYTCQPAYIFNVRLIFYVKLNN